MALHDEIFRDIKAGQVPWRFKTGDLKTRPMSGMAGRRFYVGKGDYALNAINSIPRNHSVRPDGSDPGWYVRDGRPPAFFWYQPGEYELILDRQLVLENVDSDVDDFDDVEGEDETLITSNPHIAKKPLTLQVDERLVTRIAQEVDLDPVAIIIRYVAEKPFQAHYLRHPISSIKNGWGPRLAGYHWPSPNRTWQAASSTVGVLSSEIQLATRRLELDPCDSTAAAALLLAFKGTCVWGGVRLPESDLCTLAAEVLHALPRLLMSQEPPRHCRLNSAWTKLYAFALPDNCVIYDSRVATALTSILDPVMIKVSTSPKWQPYRALGSVNGRGGSRPRDLTWLWPNGYQAWSSQIAANRLCVGILEELNNRAKAGSEFCKSNDSSPWSLREVEAVLFMEGY